MKRYVSFPLEGGGEVVVEVEEPQSEYGAVAVSRPDKVAEKAAITFEQAVEQVRPAITAVVEKLRTLQPDEVNVEFGLKLSTAAGAFLASAAGEAHFKVSVTWKKEPPAAFPKG